MRKILFFEPDKSILKETARFLQNKGYTIVGAEEGASGVEKALEIQPDIILCNVDLPDIDGYEVLKKLQHNKSTATIPFVLLMNNATVQKIREAMNLGIDDCLAKPFHFDDLLKAIEIRLKNKQKTIGITNKIIEQQRQYLDVLPKTTRDGFWIINSKGYIIDVNDTYCKMSGFSRDEILQMKIKDQDALESEEDAKARMQRIKEKGYELFETRHWRKDKTVFDVEISVTYLAIQGGQYICFCRDITQRKRAEKEVADYASMLDLAPSAIAIHDVKGNFLYSNQKNLQWHGYTSEEFRQLSIHDVDVPESRELIEERIEKIENEGEAAFEVKHYRKDGSIIPLLLFVKKIDWNGTPAMLSIGTDITEHKKAQSALKESEKKYRRIAKNISDVVWITDLNLKTTFVSPSIEKLTGEKPDDHLNIKFEDRYPPQSLQKIQTIFNEELNREKDPKVDKSRSKIIELQQYHTNGTILWVSVNVSFIRDEKGNAIGLQGVTRDITKRKQAELELKQSNQRNEAILEALPDIMFVFSRDGVFLDYYASKTDDVLMAPEQFLNKKDHEVLPGYLAEVNQHTLKKLFKTGKVQNYSYTLEMNGKTMYFDARMVKLDGKRALSIVRNITEQKVAESALKESEEKYRDLYLKTPVMLHSIDHEGRLISVSDFWLEKLGYTKEEVIGRKSFEFLTPESQKKFYEYFPVFKERGEMFDLQYQMVKKNGEIIDVLISAITENNADGTLKHRLAVIVDITERKKAEKALQEKNDLLERVFDSNLDLIALADLEGNYTLAGKSHEILGYDIEYLIGKNVMDFVHPDDADFVSKEFAQFLKTGEDRKVEYRNKRIDGTYFWFESIGTILKDKDGKPEQILFNTRNITEQKKAQDELIHSYNLMQYIIEHNRSAIAVHDKNLHYIYVSKPYFKQFKVKDKDIIGKHHYEVFPDLPQKWRDVHQKALQGIVSSAEDDPYYKEDGSVEWTRWECRPWYESDGSVGGIIVYTEVITERKNIEIELKEKTSFLSTLLETSPVGIVTVDKTGNITYANNRAEQILSLVKEEITSRTYDAPLWKHTDLDGSPLPDEKQPFNIVKKSLNTVFDVQHGITWPDGGVVILSINAAPIKDSKGQFNGMIASIEDISELKKAEEALKKSEEKFKNLFEDNVASMFLIEADTGNLVDVNEAAVKFYGWSREEMCRMNINQINALSPEELKKEMAKAKNSRRLHYEFQHRKADGSVRDVEVFGSRIEIEGKGYMHSIIHDITEKKKAGKELTEQKELLTAIYRNAPLIMMVVNKERRVQQINGYAKQFAGRDAEEMLGLHSGEALRCLHALDDPKGCGFGDFCQQCVIRNSILDTLKTGETHLQEEAPYFFKGEDDKIREMTFMTSTTAIMVKGERMVLVTLQDITERKLAEKALKESEERFRYLFRDIRTIAVQGYRFDGTTTYWNKASENLYGYTAEEAIGHNLHDLIIPLEMQENVRNEMQQMYESRKAAQSSEMTLIRKDGTRVSVLVNHAIVQRHNHEPELFCLDIDITQRKQAEKMLQERNEIIQEQNEEYESLNEELRQANEELFEAKEHAEESDRLKSAFLANMSHEIRTPMNSILGFSSLLDTNNLSEKTKKHYIRIIQTSGKNLVQIVNDVIDIAMIESGQLKISKTEVSLNQLFYDLYEIFIEKIKTDNLNIQLNLKIPDEEYTLVTDELRVKQILTNFLSNAFKFTEKGEIELGFRGVKNNKVKLYVKDTGIGIPKDKLKTIFERFQQADDSTTRKYGGTGLGLTISKNLVELLNSKIGVKSEMNKGSEFYFTLSGDQG